MGIATTIVDDCWNRIGIRGDRSCPQLPQHVHCHNCPVYSSRARALLDKPAPAGYAEHWTQYHAQPAQQIDTESQSVIVFRLGAEWFALPTQLCTEVASARSIRSLPHRRHAMVLGLTSVRGELVVCISLPALLGIEAATGEAARRNATTLRLLVVSWPDGPVAFPVDEVQGVQRFRREDTLDAPATIAQSQTTFTKSLLSCAKHSAGLLDDEAMRRAINRSLA